MFEINLINCFLLLIPPLVWNIIFYNKLPEFYKENSASKKLNIIENILRILCFGFTIFIPIQLEGKLFLSGLLIYNAGLLIYFTSWLYVIFFNRKSKKNIIIMLSPAFTSLIWLAGICIIGNSLIFVTLSFAFIFFHVLLNIKKLAPINFK